MQFFPGFFSFFLEKNQFCKFLLLQQEQKDLQNSLVLGQILNIDFYEHLTCVTVSYEPNDTLVSHNNNR